MKRFLLIILLIQFSYLLFSAEADKNDKEKPIIKDFKFISFGMNEYDFYLKDEEGNTNYGFLEDTISLIGYHWVRAVHTITDKTNEPFKGKANANDVTNMAIYYSQMINSAIYTGIYGGLGVCMVPPGAVLLYLFAQTGGILFASTTSAVTNFAAYDAAYNAALAYFTGGLILLAAGGLLLIIAMVYGIMTGVYGSTYSNYKKRVLKELNGEDTSFNNDFQERKNFCYGFSISL